MIETAERVAVQYGVSRQDMDEFALLSQSRAVAARDDGSFAREILPVPVGGTVVERPAPGCSAAMSPDWHPKPWASARSRPPEAC